MSRFSHMSMSVRGAIHNIDSSYRAFTDDDGKPMKKRDVLEQLLDHVAKGHRLLPLCDAKECPNFDHEKGCPGHEDVPSSEVSRG